MPTDKRRSDARRRAWGRGPMILRFEPLEGRELLATSAVALPDLVAAQFDTLHNLDWGDSFQARGEVLNQGNAAAASPFNVNIYASTTPALTSGSLLIGRVTVPAGLQPGARVAFDQNVSLPPTALEGLTASGAVYVSLAVDPEGAVAERSETNNVGTGQGYDTSVVTITPRVAPSLVGTSIGAYPDQAYWGQSLLVNAQITNNAAGDAPATRARVVLTPSGIAPGGPADVTVGSIAVPAIPAWQTALLSQSIQLPQYPPLLLFGSTQFVLSVVRDADFQASPFSPQRPTQGLGYDMTNVTIAFPQDIQLNPNAAHPDLTSPQVLAPSLVAFGQTFQVTATVQNQGNLDSGPFRVRFLLVGTDGSLDTAMFLADATLDGIKAGHGQDVVQTLRLPTKLPNGASLDANAQGRIAILIDPENVTDEFSKTNNLGISEAVALQLVRADGTVTTTSVPPATPTPTPAPTTPTPTQAPRIPGLAARRRVVRPTTPTVRPTGTDPVPVRTPTVPDVAARRQFGPRAVRATPGNGLRVFPGRA